MSSRMLGWKVDGGAIVNGAWAPGARYLFIISTQDGRNDLLGPSTHWDQNFHFFIFTLPPYIRMLCRINSEPHLE